MRVAVILLAAALACACTHAAPLRAEPRQVFGSHNGWTQGGIAPAQAPVTLVFAVKQQQLQVCLPSSAAFAGAQLA